jgi:hypothetical protein
MRWLWTAIPCLQLLLVASPGNAHNLNDTWVWCEPSNPLTYFIESSADEWAEATNKGAASWSDNTPWNLQQSANADDARIIIQTVPVNTVMQLLVNRDDDHPRADFTVIKWGYIEIFGLRKPCAEKARIRYWIDPQNPPANKQNTATHELGHALGLNDTNSREDIMYKVEQDEILLSPTDIQLATESSQNSHLNQLHRLVTPQPAGTSLAFRGVEVLIPGNAISQPVTFGIRPLSFASLYFNELPRDRILAAAQIGPEWSADETEAVGAYVQKQIPLSNPVKVTFQLEGDPTIGVVSSQGFSAVNVGQPPIDLTTLTLVQVNLDGNITPLNSSVEEMGGDVYVSSEVSNFGNFAVMANNEVSPTAEPQEVPLTSSDNATLATNFGLRTGTFEMPQGLIEANLTDDVSAGDTVTGSVIAKPQGETPLQLEANGDELSGHVVTVQATQTDDPTTPEDETMTTTLATGNPGQYLTFSIPDAVTAIKYLLTDAEGNEVGYTDIPVGPPRINLPVTHRTPAIAQSGRPVTIDGPFNGYVGDSGVQIGSQPAPVIAESPGRVVAQSPNNVVGPTTIEVEEEDTTVIQQPIRNVQISLSAGQTTLQQGQETNLDIQVTGLQGLENELPVQVENLTPGIVRLPGGIAQTLLVSPNDVTSDGIAHLALPLTGIATGPFNVRAVIDPTQTAIPSGTL